MYILCLQAKQENKWKFVVVAVTIYAIVFGLRYGAGVDFYGSPHSYNDMLVGKEVRNLEIGFTALMKVLSALNLHSLFFFGLNLDVIIRICIVLVTNAIILTYLYKETNLKTLLGKRRIIFNLNAI